MATINADVVLLGANPLENAAHLHDVAGVVRDGRLRRHIRPSDRQFAEPLNWRATPTYGET